MYKVLIVDDEKIIRIALKSMINWEELGYSVCAAAADSDSALALMKEHQPHLMIIDIMMPKTDGLTFLKLARQQGYKGQAIILTNHQDFQYAVEALHNGAFDYILKTDISPESLADVLTRLKTVLDTQVLPWEIPKENTELDCIRKIIQQEFSVDEPVVFSKPYLFLDIFLRTKIIRQHQQNSIPKNALLNIIQEILEPSGYPVIQYAPNAALALISQDNCVKFVSGLPVLTDKIQKLIKLYMNCDSGFVCSNAFSSSAELLEKLKHLEDMERLVFYTDFHTIIREENLAICTETPINLAALQKRIKQDISQKKYETCKDFIHKEFHRLADEHLKVPLLVNLISGLYKFLIFDYSTYLEKSSEKLQEIAIKHQTACTLEEYLEPLYSLIELIEKNQIAVQTSSFSEELSVITEYINQNLDKKITLSMLATHVNRSENYLSRLFKAETGINIVAYINQQKMEHAKELLTDSSLSIKEIASSLGFDEPSYFNKLFNKLYNINPSDYRKKLLI